LIIIQKGGDNMWKFIAIWIIASIVFAVIFGAIVNKDEPPATLTSYNHKDKIVYVQLHEMLVSGSDGACQGAGMVILAIIETMGPEWKVHVTNDWVPSKYNPIDYTWARKLAEGY
jgi:hypothetical protein